MYSSKSLIATQKLLALCDWLQLTSRRLLLIPFLSLLWSNLYNSILFSQFNFQRTNVSATTVNNVLTMCCKHGVCVRTLWAAWSSPASGTATGARRRITHAAVQTLTALQTTPHGVPHAPFYGQASF